MKVYEIVTDPDTYQELSFDDNGYDLDQLEFFKGARNGTWQQPKNWYVPNVMAEKGDFVSIDGALAFAAQKETLDLLRPVLPPQTEKIELTYPDERLYLINFTWMSECLDYEKSEYCTATDDPKDLENAYTVEKYIFDPDKFSEHSVFRLKAGRILPIRLYCYEGVKSNPEEEFKYFVEKNNLKGLLFRTVWDSEKE